MSEYIKGVDISAVQGTVDFNWLKSQNIQFVIIKCGDGNNNIDKMYSSNLSKAKAAGLKVGVYHVVFPLPTDPNHSGRSPIEQAKMHFEASKGECAFMDLEWPIPQDWKKWGCTAAQINQWVLEYLQEYERLSGQKIPVYTYPSFAQMVKFTSEIAEYPLWIASYQPKPTVPKPWTDWQIWQTSGGDFMHLPNGVKVDTNMAKDLSLFEPKDVPAKANIFTKVVNLFSDMLK